MFKNRLPNKDYLFVIGYILRVLGSLIVLCMLFAQSLLIIAVVGIIYGVIFK
jgi:hypothetical protein